MKEVYAYTKEKMSKTIAALERDYASIRAGRASAAVLDKIENKSAFINNAIHSYSSGRVPDMQRVSMVFCRLEKKVGQLADSVDVSGLLEELNELCRCLRS